MKSIKVRAYIYEQKCLECETKIRIYYTVPSFGDPPHLMRCCNCNQYYVYTSEDTYYLKTLCEQIKDYNCEKCNMQLTETLVEPHENIKCCGCEDVFSLDKDYLGNKIPDKSHSVIIEVFDLYSN